MPNMSARAYGALSLSISLFCLVSASARADLVWHPDTGWQIEGGVLAGMGGKEGQTALNLMNKARAAEEKGSEGSAIRGYKKVAKKHAASPFAPEALYRSAKLYLVRKQYFKAYENFARVTGGYPKRPTFQRDHGRTLSHRQRLARWSSQSNLGRHSGLPESDTAISYFELIVRDAPYSDYAPLALMNKARGHLRQREIEEAIDSLDYMINNYPQSLLAPDAYIGLAQTHARMVDGPYYDQAATKEAITYFEDFLILFPSDENIPKAARGLDSMKEVSGREQNYSRRLLFQISEQLWRGTGVLQRSDHLVSRVTRRCSRQAETGRGRGKSHPARARSETSEEEETFLLLLKFVLRRHPARSPGRLVRSVPRRLRAM